jgi:hypothetical protein
MDESAEEYSSKIGFTLDRCRDLVSAKKVPRNQKNDKKICEGLLSAASGLRVTYGPENLQKYYPGTVNWTYVLDRRKLVEADMTTSAVEGGVTFSSAVDDLIRTYGQPIRTGTKTAQNGFGNTFETGTAAWLMSDGCVILAEEGFFLGNVRLRTVTVAFRSPDEVKRLIMNDENRPNIFK